MSSILSCFESRQKPVNNPRVQRFKTGEAYVVYVQLLRGMTSQDEVSIQRLQDGRIVRITCNMSDVFYWTTDVELPRNAKLKQFADLSYVIEGDNLVFTVPRRVGLLKRWAACLRPM